MKAAKLLTPGLAGIPNKLCVHSAWSPLITLPGPSCFCAWGRAHPQPWCTTRGQLRVDGSKYKPRSFWRTGGNVSFVCFSHSQCVLLLSLIFWNAGTEMISDGVKAIQNKLFQEEHIVQTISPWSSNILVTTLICQFAMLLNFKIKVEIILHQYSRMSWTC